MADCLGKSPAIDTHVERKEQHEKRSGDRTRNGCRDTEGVAHNDGSEDTSTRQTGTTLPGGTVFRIVEFGPGVSPRNHRTDSIDYAVVISGEIDMVLDDTTVHLKAGDVLVQRGTIHNWINNGAEPCTIAFSLIDAKAVEVNGHKLDAHG